MRATLVSVAGLVLVAGASAFAPPAGILMGRCHSTHSALAALAALFPWFAVHRRVQPCSPGSPRRSHVGHASGTLAPPGPP